MNVIKLSALAALVGALSACGGGGGGVAGTPTTLSGTVIDGYIKGAIVCLDTNSNQKCDGPSIDPQATTAADGSYSFTYTGNVAGMHVIAEVPVGAIDSDLGAITQPYSMLAPAAAESKTAPSVITPLTTMVSSEMLANKTSATEAEASVKANLNLSTPLVGYDFKKAGDTNTTAVAQVAAAAIASATSTLKADTTVAAAGLTAGDIAKKAAEQVKDRVLPQVISATGKVTVADSSSQDKVIAQVSQQVTNIVSGQVQNIVVATKSGDSSVVDLTNIFKTTGLVLAYSETGDYINELGKRVDGTWRAFVDALTIEWIKFDLATATAPSINTQRVLVNNKWYQKYEGSENVSFDGSNWVLSGGTNQGKPTISGNCIELPQTKTGNLSDVACATSKDLSGKKITDFIPNLCKNGSGTISGCDANATFPSGSIAYDLTVTSKQDNYTLWPSIDTWTGYNTVGTNDIYGFIAATKQYPQWMGGGCNTGFMVASYDDKATPKATKGTVKWGTNTSKNGCTDAKVASYTETTNFEIVTVGGKELIKIETANLFRSNNHDNRAYTIFGYHKGTVNSGVWNGEFKPANFKQSIQFTGDPNIGTQVVSPILLDSVLKQKGVTAYPYPTN
jgi:hypothetical protein